MIAMNVKGSMVFMGLIAQDTDYFLISTHSLRARESATAWTTRM